MGIGIVIATDKVKQMAGYTRAGKDSAACRQSMVIVKVFHVYLGLKSLWPIPSNYAVAKSRDRRGPVLCIAGCLDS